VLTSFIKSFGLIHELAHQPETAVYESYLEGRWLEAGVEAKQMGQPSEASALQLRDAMLQLQTLPTGEHAVALMRLIAQGQVVSSQLRLLAAFNELSSDDKRVLAEEMARTGIAGQAYARHPPDSSGDKGKHSASLRHEHSAGAGLGFGPAILVYYSPAFVRALASADKPVSALRLLAEVYRRARVLWPLEPYDATSNDRNSVTVRVDQIKGLTLEQIHNVYATGNSWLVYKRNEQEAIVECHTIDFMADLLQQGTRCAVLKFYNKRRKPKVADAAPGAAQAGASGGSSNNGDSENANSSFNSDGSHTPKSNSGSDPGESDPDARVVRWVDGDEPPATLMRANSSAHLASRDASPSGARPGAGSRLSSNATTTALKGAFSWVPGHHPASHEKSRDGSRSTSVGSMVSGLLNLTGTHRSAEPSLRDEATAAPDGPRERPTLETVTV
jgi:hypothetical protein